MSERPVVEEERPQPVGLNRRNIGIATVVAVALLGGTAFLLMRPPTDLVELERRAPRIRAEPERQVADRRQPPVLRAEPAEREFLRPAPAVIERPRQQVDQGPPPRARRSLYEDALRSSLAFPKKGSAVGTAPERGSRSRAGIGGDLERMLADLERQGARLGELGGLSSMPGGELFGGPSVPEVRSEISAPRLLPAPDRPYLSRGTLIPGQLLTAINSDLPGQILGTVVRDVLDSGALERVVIPKGSRLVGRYDADLAVGQNRVFVAWSEIQFPSGERLILPEQPGVDGTGASGLADRVNHHTGRILGQAALLSLIGAGFELSRPADSGLVDRAGRAITGASRELEAAAAELLRRNREIRPTVKIRQGQSFQVFVTQQIQF